jgi:hypothetical protein
MKLVLTKKEQIEMSRPKKKAALIPRGKHMRRGAGWRLTDGQHVFIGTLVWTYNANGGRLAIFSVPKGRARKIDPT